MTIRGVTKQYHKKFTFLIEIRGVISAAFRTCGEIGLEIAKIEHFEGGSLIPHKGMGRVTVADVELTRGATSDLDLYNWMQEAVGAGAMLAEDAVKRTLDVVELDRAGTEVRRWTLVNAFPIKWVGGEWDNEVDENTIEKVTLAYDYPVLNTG